jgi:hypothetical protein
MLIIGCVFHTRYPADSTRLNSILFSIFYLLFSAFITPFPSVTYSGLDTIVIL